MASINTLTREFPTRDKTEVKVIQLDTTRTGYLIISTGSELFSIQAVGNITNTSTHVVGQVTAGYKEGLGPQARFNYISGVVQKSDNFFVTDKNNNCLREVTIQTGELKSWKTSVFAGSCGVGGDIDGLRRNAKFNKPAGLVSRGSYLYVADSDNKKIKRLSVGEGKDEVISVHQSETHAIDRIALGPRLGEFYATAAYGVLHIYKRMERWTIGGSYSYSGQPTSGQFSAAVLQSPQDIALLNNETLVVVDKSCVQVFDLRLEVATLMCYDRSAGFVDGNLMNCRLSSPQSVLVANETIYIGEKTTHGGVRSLTFTDSTNWKLKVTTETPELKCAAPPEVTNAFYTELNNYTKGSEVKYECVDQHSSYDSNTKLVCSVLENKQTIWVGELIKCQLNSESKAMIALAVCFSLTLLALVLAVTKLLLVMRSSRQNSQQKSTNQESSVANETSNCEYESPGRPLPETPYTKCNPHYDDIHHINGAYLDPIN